MRSSFILALLLAGPVAADEPGPTRDAFVAVTDPLGEPVDKVVYLDQGWSPAVSLKFYFTSQGSQIIPYDWFLALEQADSQTLFRDNQNILKYRYLPQLPDSNNPDGLPVGFVGDEGVGRRWLGLTCAACHTNEIRFGTTGYRVDGAPTQGDVRALLSAMITAMQKTRDDPAKFERFAAKVLGNQNSSSGQLLLKAQLAAAIDKRIAYNLRNFPGYNPNEPAPAPADYARLDAVGAIVNEVFYHSVKAPTTPSRLPPLRPTTPSRRTHRSAIPSSGTLPSRSSSSGSASPRAAARSTCSASRATSARSSVFSPTSSSPTTYHMEFAKSVARS